MIFTVTGCRDHGRTAEDIPPLTSIHCTGWTRPQSKPINVSEGTMESKTRTSRRKVLEVGGKSSALALAFLATLRSAGGVGAERPPANGDSHQRQCRSIYDLVQALLAEYKRVGLANHNS
jgi:hypothetical protein